MRSVANNSNPIQVNDSTAWNLLPEAFGMGLTSSTLKHAYFDVATAGHNNNLRCAAEAIKALICSFARLPLPNESKLDPEVSIQQAFERCFSSSFC